MDAHTVGPFPTAAHAFLGVAGVSHTFRFNPDDSQWSYQENTNSTDTIGGRVVQILSVQVQGLTVHGRAGSRGELQRLADNVRKIMEYHVQTSRPVTFRVPSRNWNFLVYVSAMPQVGWDVSATSYPYQIELSIYEDITGVQSRKLQLSSLARLAQGIGYNPNVHGGASDAFVQEVKSLLAASSTSSGSGNNATVGSQGGDVNLPSGNDHVSQVVLDAAKSQLGVPYVSGAESPGHGFDCSGLTQFCYSKAGVAIPKYTEDQYNLCKQKHVVVSKDNLMPADILFYHIPGEAPFIGHVGIYVGNGKMIAAPHTGANVQVEGVLWSNFVCGGRPRQ